MRWNRALSLLIILVPASGCLPLPAPSITRTDSKLVEQPRAEGDTILIFGRNAERPPRGAILGPKGLADEMGRLAIPEGPEWKPPDAFARELSQAHVRYLVAVGEDVDTRRPPLAGSSRELSGSRP